MKRLYNLFILILALILAGNNLNSQSKGLSVSAGISNYWLIGENNARLPLFERDPKKPFIIGGGFEGVQPGTALKLSFDLDKNGNFVLPIGFDYSFFDSRQRIPISSKTIAYLKHYIDIPSISVGINYNFIKFPFADVKAFLGLDAKGFFINQGYLYRKIDYGIEEITDVVEIKTKDATFRLGGLAYIGFEGAIIRPFYIQTTFGVGAMNLVGKDDTRYELLTPKKDSETQESTVTNIYFSLMLKYRF
jgi:hypothetical protein